MANSQLPSPELLRQLLAYDPETGMLTWLLRPVAMFPSVRSWKVWNGRFAGKIALTAIDGGGYFHGTVLGRQYYAHRVIWVIVHGEWPNHIDHISGIRTDNRMSNLRNVSKSGNAKNMKMNAVNTSGVTGVHWNKMRMKWVASIGSGLKAIHIGSFEDFDDAVSARKRAEVEYGFSAGHGRSQN